MENHSSWIRLIIISSIAMQSVQGTSLDRISGALFGAAIGDAFGRVTANIGL